MKLTQMAASGLLRGVGLLSHPVPSVGAEVAFRLMSTPRRKPFGDGEADAQWRTSAGLRVYAWGKTGPLVICLHGWEGSGRQFCGLANHLKARGFRVWALDAVAHGDSPGLRATPLDLFYSLCELRAQTREPVSVVGHSVGASAVMLALREGLIFSRRVLIAGPTSFTDMFAYFNRAIGLSARSYGLLVGKLENYMGRKLDCADMLQTPPRGPALIVHDSRDKEVPLASSEALVRVWPQAELWVTQGLGHRRVLSDSAVWERIARYLSESNPPAATPETESHPECSANP